MKIAEMLRENANEFGKIDTLDHGSPTKMAAFTPIVTADRFGWAAYNAESLMGHTIPVSPETLVYLQREPIGVIACITPWNGPLPMIASKLAPALTLGNTCVIKPPSVDSPGCSQIGRAIGETGNTTRHHQCRHRSW